MSKVHIVMYHYVRDLKHSRYPEIKGLDISLFKQQLQYMKQHFNFVSMEELIAASTENYQLPDNAVCLTFDDGYIDNYTYVLPALEEEGIKGAFFIPGKTFTTHQLLDVNKIHYVLASADTRTLLPALLEKLDYYRGTEFDYAPNDELFEKYGVASRFDTAETIFIKRILQTALPEPVRNRISSDLFEKYVGVSEETLAYELYMTADQVRLLKRHGMYIGPHGYDHYWLANLDEEKMHEDIDKSLDIMGEFIDKSKWAMNYPYGNSNENVIAYLKQKGACLGLATIPGIADLHNDNPMMLPRLDCNDLPPKSNNFLNY